ncbi:hypothetical protein Leryth_001215 [Lithospermum erythrorhizon]|uniref:Oxidoreductase n=1 Tax=Lithospermum erythrorhizon TaxID=34254 RepID=A0AAV3RVM4_LITER|nr:hypothetical protein Leryth_001215 [Lithospermum erythrorhizon]
MGCASSKGVDAAVDVYQQPPTSFAVFDIDSIEEPWLKNAKVEDNNEVEQVDEKQEKAAEVPDPLLQKLNTIDDAPGSWDEVSKALEEIKPKLKNPVKKPPQSNNQSTKSGPLMAINHPQEEDESPKKRTPRKSFSFHTLEELDTKVSNKQKQTELRKTESMRRLEFKKMDSDPKLPESSNSQQFQVGVGSSGDYKPVKQNIFIIKDKMERQKEGKDAPIVKYDLLSDYQDLCPPGGADSVVLYTTSLGGVRRTFEDCNRVRSILELHGVVFDERDISLHGKFLNELKELCEGASVPRMFVKGKYLGGVEEVVSLNETGKLGRIFNRARVERGAGRQSCTGCGGVRFVPCLDCGGSCKIVVGDKKERCQTCNENGLVHCPACA